MHFGGLRPHMSRIVLRRVMLWTLVAWAEISLAVWGHIWPESSSEGSFCGLWRPGPRYSQNRPQKGHFVDFVGLSLDMTRIGLGSVIVWTLVAWAEMWPQSSSESSFCGLWQLGPRYSQNRPQKGHFVDFGGLGPHMARIVLRRLLAAWAEIWSESCSKD